jgi:FkbM family methyltransferase
MNHIDLTNFDWGWMNDPTNTYHVMPDGTYKQMGEYHRESITQEIFVDKCYEKFFEVEEGDVVLDIGASVGPFTYSILHKKPKHVFCFEPSESEFKTLVKNTIGHSVTHINKGISNVNSVVMNDHLFGGEDQMESITFKKFIDLYGIEKIDFLKTDCEGGEFHIFTDENFDWIKSNVRKIVGEWHIQLQGHNYVEKFKEFRNNYLSKFENVQVYSIDNIDIKWDLWNDHFLEYYRQIIIHIDNR